jgi:mercuric ion transport protein
MGPATDYPARTQARTGSWALGTAGIAALLASSCCLLPLVLVSLGLSGAWLSYLRVLQPYSPILTAIAVAALLLAGRHLFRAASVCSVEGGSHREGPHRGGAPRTFLRALFWIITGLTVLLLVLPLVAPWLY